MKSYLIEIPEQNELQVMTMLQQLSVQVQPVWPKPVKKGSIKTKTVAHFLAISKDIVKWNDDEIERIERVHQELNQIQPQSW